MKSQKNILTFKSMNILIEKKYWLPKCLKSKSAVFETLIF